MKYLFIILTIVIGSCSKNRLREPTCHFYSLYSDKYKADSTYVRTDTLRGKVGEYCYACNSDIDSMKANMITWRRDCTGYPIQCERYVFDKAPSSPILLK